LGGAARNRSSFRRTAPLSHVPSLLWAYGHHGGGRKIPAEVLRDLLGRNRIVKEAKTQEEPSTTRTAALCRIESIRLEDRMPGNAFDVDGLHRPLQLHGERNRGVASDSLS